MDLNDGYKVPYAANAHEKQLGLARDYFNSGKSVDWVLSMVAGTDPKAQSKILTLAREMSVISPAEFRAKLEKHKIDEKGVKKRK